MKNKRAHLEMIQAVISRMSVNSFLLKGDGLRGQVFSLDPVEIGITPLLQTP